MSLVNELIKGLLFEEETKKTVGIYAGGFKPPTKGHFQVLKEALDENPEIDELIVYIGKKERNGVSQEISLDIWEIYGKHLPFKVKYVAATKPPIQLVYNYAKENPNTEVLWILGAREESEDDFKDIASRTKGMSKYPNLELRTIVTTGGVSGTAARNAAKVSPEKLNDFLPDFLSDKEQTDIFVMLNNIVTEAIVGNKIECDNCDWSWEIKDGGDDLYICHKCGHNNTPFLNENTTLKLDIPKFNYKKSLNENSTYSQSIDLKKEIAKLTKHMLDKGMNIQPLPKLILRNGDNSNAKEFLGKTAYYDPNSMSIVLYTEGRHPKDIARSFSHEMVHHTQNLENRLGNIGGTNTMEDDNLNKLEQEANLKGTMTFRNWTDSLNEALNFKDLLKQTENLTNNITVETLFEEEDILMAEVVNPDGERFEYEESNVNGLYIYKDSFDNLYFARVTYSPSSSPRFEFKVGWFENNDISKPKYEPNLPPNTTGMDNLKRRNTVAKIYRDEVLPFLKNNQNLAKQLDINPISNSRYIFSQRLVQKNTPSEYNIDLRDGKLIISLSNIKETKNKDPFGINAYAMELGRLREEETEYQIYCDMDGVLADFEKGYEKLTGINLQVEKPEGAKFWDPIQKAGVGFWAGLEWMSDGKQLWDYIKDKDTKLLSAPSRDKSSRIGKHVWVKHKIPGTKLILRYASQKQELATPTSILIDDRKPNIDQWEAAGGIGILHTNTADTIKQLQKLGL